MLKKPPTIRVPHRGTLPLPCAGDRIGPYEVLEEGLPEDGFYLFDVRHPRLEAERRLKAVSESRTSPEFIQELSARLRAVGALSSPFLHRPLESGFDEPHKLYYSVYEKLAPKSLRDLENYGALSGEEALTVLLAAAGGLAALEQAGLHHGRLAPEMIVFTEDFRQIKLDGLDIAPEERGSGPLPGSGEAEGISGDLYTLGRIAYRMVTGRVPSATEGNAGNDPRQYRPDFPGPLAVIILRLLSNDSVTGFQCAAELDSELKMLLSRMVPAEAESLYQAPKREIPEVRAAAIPPPPPAEVRSGRNSAGASHFRFGRSGLVIAVLVILLVFTVTVRLMVRAASAPTAAPPVFQLSPENQRLRGEQDRLSRELERLTRLRNAWRRNRVEGGK